MIDSGKRECIKAGILWYKTKVPESRVHTKLVTVCVSGLRKIPTRKLAELKEVIQVDM